MFPRQHDKETGISLAFLKKPWRHVGQNIRAANKTKEKTLASTRPGRIRYTRSQTHEQIRTLTKPVLIASCKRSQKHGHTALRREGTDRTHKLQLYFVYCPSHP